MNAPAQFFFRHASQTASGASYPDFARRQTVSANTTFLAPENGWAALSVTLCGNSYFRASIYVNGAHACYGRFLGSGTACFVPVQKDDSIIAQTQYSPDSGEDYELFFWPNR